MASLPAWRPLEPPAHKNTLLLTHAHVHTPWLAQPLANELRPIARLRHPAKLASWDRGKSARLPRLTMLDTKSPIFSQHLHRTQRQLPSSIVWVATHKSLGSRRCFWIVGTELDWPPSNHFAESAFFDNGDGERRRCVSVCAWLYLHMRIYVRLCH